MWVIVCLGNPGKSYQKTRHNVGFMVGDSCLEAWNGGQKSKKFSSELSDCQISGHKVLLVFPQTYMNLSGEAVVKVVNYFRLPLSRLIVVYDDFDLPFGQIRLREKGSAGTHNGLKSVAQSLNSTAFARLRLGIGPKPEGDSVSDYVLSNFTKDETKYLPDMINQAQASLETAVTLGISKAMAKYNGQSIDQENAT